MMKKYIGNAAFYRTALGIALPIMMQNAITHFVGLLDNIMVGRLGTLQMSGVSIVNQLIFVFNLCIFGAVAGPGIFTAQFAGRGDNDGVRHTLRFKIVIGMLISVVAIILFCFAGEPLCMLYLQGESKPEDIAATLSFAQDYLKIMVIGLVPYTLSNAYAGTMRETKQTVVPMASGIAAVVVNMVLNYVLIFGKFGAPRLGVVGAAVATVIARFAEFFINAIWLHTHTDKNPYAKGLYTTFKMPRKLAVAIALKGFPLLVNEGLWSSAMAVISQGYSTRGIEVVAAHNISSTVWNLFSVCYIALGNAVGIIIGQMLGAGKDRDEIRNIDRKLIAFDVSTCAIFGSLMAACSGIFPLIYNTTDDVRTLAAQLMCISAALMPFYAYTHAAYFTIRSGGKTLIVFIFDSCFVWLICAPTAIILSRFTAMPIQPLFAITQGVEIIRCLLGGYMLKKEIWIQNLTDK